MSRRVVLITGGSRGIGRACASRFAREGWQTLYLCRRLPENPVPGAEGFVCDLRSAEETETVFRDLEKRYGHLDALVNNAGIALQAMLQDTTDAQWRELFAVDLDAAMRLTRLAAPGMISRRRGSVINIASMWGEVGASCESAYSAAKAGLIGLTKALAKELGPSGVRVNCVSPGLIDTEMNAHLSAEDLAALAEETPLGRLGAPDEVAAAVCFLAGDEASFITGQTLGVNGGLVVS